MKIHRLENLVICIVYCSQDIELYVYHISNEH
jgi:hypothetical protein